MFSVSCKCVLLYPSIPRAERNEYAKLLLQVLKSSKLEPPFTTDPPQGLLPRLGTFKPITRTGASTQQQPIGTQSTNTQREVEKTENQEKARRRTSEHKGTRHHHTTRDHRTFEQILEATAASPLYLIQTNVPDSGIGEGRVHTSEEGLWSLDTGPSASLRRPNPQVGVRTLYILHDYSL